ncbi:MAG: hypothetical protein H7247_12010 [Polaromonas sp.]|nr:hypothetical protein [Gemmatimonadaceae bacterium]
MAAKRQARDSQRTAASVCSLGRHQCKRCWSIEQGETTPMKAANKASGKLASNNIFEDLGFEDPDTELLKADLILAISEKVRDEGITQTVEILNSTVR